MALACSKQNITHRCFPPPSWDLTLQTATPIISVQTALPCGPRLPAVASCSHGPCPQHSQALQRPREAEPPACRSCRSKTEWGEFEGLSLKVDASELRSKVSHFSSELSFPSPVPAYISSSSAFIKYLSDFVSRQFSPAILRANP